jgi:hypothetical protein
MRVLKLKYIATALVTAILAYCYANPAFAVCALADTIPSEAEADALTIDTEHVAEARSRISNSFGEPRATPKVIFWKDNSFLAWLKLNAYGTTQFIGSRACVIVGPKGSNVDVVAHELMHVEIFDRVGYWVRMTQLPVWFDEGIAMQVDNRSDYNLPEGEDSSFVRQHDKASEFFDDSSKQLTRNYAAAKSEVRDWLNRDGTPALYSILQQLQNGHAFKTLVK